MSWDCPGPNWKRYPALCPFVCSNSAIASPAHGKREGNQIYESIWVVGACGEYIRFSLVWSRCTPAHIFSLHAFSIIATIQNRYALIFLTFLHRRCLWFHSFPFFWKYFMILWEFATVAPVQIVVLCCCRSIRGAFRSMPKRGRGFPFVLQRLGQVCLSRLLIWCIQATQYVVVAVQNTRGAEW